MRGAICLVVARLVVAGLAVAGCWRASPPHGATDPSRPLVVPRERTTKPDRPGELYALDEALADAFSGPWTFVGTGEWFGMFRVNACVYRNARVFIVNIYCTLREKKAFGLVVLSPTRGRVYIYAEGDHPISTTTRKDWITFKGEAHLPVEETLRLDFTYAELRAWDERRYYKHAPACFGGVEIHRPQKGCLRLDAQIEPWANRNREFLQTPNDDWYRIIRELRKRVTTDARPYTGP
jgi:hypothetical protein